MNHEEQALTGIIDCSSMVFHEQEYQFTFIPTALQEGVVTLSSQGSFILGATHSRKRIAIYSGNKGLPVFHSMRYTAPLYVVSEMNKPDLDIGRFYRLFFIGGILNNLFEARSLKEKIGENHAILIDRAVCRDEYSFSTNEYSCKLFVGLTTTDTMNHHSYSYSEEAYLIMEFDKPQPLSSLLSHYRRVNQAISFMTHRQENHIGEIKIDTSTNPEEHYVGRCLAHIRENDMAAAHQNTVVSFDRLGDGFANLLRIVYNSKENSPSYSLGFIPRNDDERWSITDDTVRTITSALECEIQAQKDLRINQSPELLALCESVKQLVYDHKEKHRSNPIITDETYNMVFNSIGNWTNATSERIIALFHKFDQEMKLHFQEDDRINEADIRALVKYRNSITHGNYREMTPEIRKTVIAMKVLVYISLLSRIGVSITKADDISAFAIIM